MSSSASHFNADELRAAQQEPTLTVGNLLYRGRLLSIEEWLPFAERIDALRVRQEKGERITPAEWVAEYRAYLRAVFPRRRYRFWAPDPVRVLLKQPWVVVAKAVACFFDLQARATDPSASVSSTSGISSLASTPEPQPTTTSPSSSLPQS